MAFPTTGVLDNFNRANSGAPPSASWTADTGLGPNLLVVNTNQVASSAGNNGFAFWNPNTFTDSEVFITVAVKPGNGSYISVYVRYDATGNNGYEFELDPVAGTDTCQHYRVDNAVFTALGAAISQEFTAGDGLGLAVSGSTLQGYRNSGGWAALGTTRSDSTYTAAANLALQIGDTTARGDDFGGGETVVSGDTLMGQAVM